MMSPHLQQQQPGVKDGYYGVEKTLDPSLLGGGCGFGPAVVGRHLPVDPSSCTFWCTVAMGALVKGRPIESVRGWVFVRVIQIISMCVCVCARHPAVGSLCEQCGAWCAFCRRGRLFISLSAVVAFGEPLTQAFEFTPPLCSSCTSISGTWPDATAHEVLLLLRGCCFLGIRLASDFP